MAITLVGTSDGEAGATPFSVAAGIAVQAGDLVLFKIKIRNSGTTEVGLSADLDPSSTCSIGAVSYPVNSWSTTTAFRPQIKVGLAVVTSGGTLLGRIPTTSGRSSMLCVSVWRGVDVDSVLADFDVLRLDDTTSTTFTGPVVTPSQAGDCVVAVAADYGSALTHTKTSVFTLISKRDNADGNYISEYYIAPDTANVTSAPTVDTARSYVNGTVVLRAAPEVVPGTVISRGSFF